MKNPTKLLASTILLLAGLIVLSAVEAADFDLTHARFATALKNTVRDGQVDYARLKSDPADLDVYLRDLASVSKEDFAKWSREDRLATWINLYNAHTLRLILDHYPLQSIRSIGVLPGAAWRELLVRFGGRIMSLDHLENKIIRPESKEPRIHFALVCAAKGCPPLRSEPYVGARLDSQLDEQARQFLATPKQNRYDPIARILWLSPIFDWYEEDFTDAAGSLLAYAKPFLPPSSQADLDGGEKVRIRFTEYDWGLNEWKH